MAEIGFRNLIPGKRYKIVFKAYTAVGTLTAFPSIDFITPEAPPRARNFRLTANTVETVKVIKSRNIKMKVKKYKIVANASNEKIVVLITHRKKNRIKPGHFIKTNFASPHNGLNVAQSQVLSRDKKYKNRVRYMHPNQNTAQVTTNPEWRVPSQSEQALVHIDGGLILQKKKKVRLRIPKPILQNLTWNEEVKDFVFVVYRKGKRRSRLGKTRYLWDTDDAIKKVINAKPPVISGEGASGNTTENDTDVTLSLDTPELGKPNYTEGHPATFIKEINDDKFYEFKFIVARYIKTTDEITGVSTWTGYWIERNTPFLKKLSRPVGWRRK